MKQVIEDFFNDDTNALISKAINQKALSNKHTKTKARIINSWISEGLLDDNRTDSQRQHRYSLVEAVWVSIIEELRDVGYSLDRIKKAKEHLLISIEGVSSRYPYFEYHLIVSILYKRPFFIRIDKNGNTQIVNHESYLMILQTQDVTTHTIISLNEMFQNLVLTINQHKWTFSELFKFSMEELKLLAFIKNHDFQTIKIVRRNGEINRLEGVERIASQKRIIDILNEGDYQDIELKQEDGKVVQIYRTVKKKL